MRYFLIIFFSVFNTGFAFSQNGKKVQFVGGARSLNTLAELDTASTPKRSGGYALLDLGIKINRILRLWECLGSIMSMEDFGVEE